MIPLPIKLHVDRAVRFLQETALEQFLVDILSIIDRANIFLVATLQIEKCGHGLMILSHARYE